MIHIITDSTCDISPERQQELGIEVLPLTVHISGASYLDGKELPPALFYEKLAAAQELPTTSQISPGTFLERFQWALANRQDVIGIFLSSKLSGTYQSAVIAQEMAQSDRVFLLDSQNATFGLGLLVEQAALLRDQGKTAEEIMAELQVLVGRVRLLAAMDTLKYLKMGGRLSTATALVGGILGICPVITIANGQVEAIGKARGRKAAFQFILTQFQKDPADETRPIAYGHSNAPEALAECQEFFNPYLKGNGLVLIGNIGAIVGTHVGPGAVGFAYFAKAD